MPRIKDEVLDCAVYLYPTESAARTGEGVGGSGFLVHAPSLRHVDPQISYVYAVTCAHNIRHIHDMAGYQPFIRLNTREGLTDVLQTEESDWFLHPDGDDVAVCMLGLDRKFHKFRSIGTDLFLREELISEHGIGPGDEVFMVGRFITHEGRQKNLPSLRFGNISIMPSEGVRLPSGIYQESFLVEARSIGGYSGSPVFVHILPMTVRPNSAVISNQYLGPWLLGIDWGHLHHTQLVKEKGGAAVQEGYYVEMHTGMMGVVPAWKLLDLLDSEEVAMQRSKQDDLWEAELAKRHGRLTPTD